MVEEKDRLGETIKLLDRAKEDIYFAQRDRELIEKLKAQLQKVEDVESKLHCPKGHVLLQTYTFQGFILDRCQSCVGVWLDNGELEAIISKSCPRSIKLLARQADRKGEGTEAQT